VADWLITVGPNGSAGTLTQAFVLAAQGPGLFQPSGGYDRTVIRLDTDIEVAPPWVPGGWAGALGPIVVQGNGTGGGSTLVLNQGFASGIFFIRGGVDVTFQDLRLDVDPTLSIDAVFLQDETSCLRFTHVTAEAEGAPDEPLAACFARVTGEEATLVARGLRVGQGFQVGIDASSAPVRFATSPVIDIRRSGFRNLDTGVSLTNISRAHIEDTTFRDSGVGFELELEMHVPPGGIISVIGCRFHDCTLGALVNDYSSRGPSNAPDATRLRSLSCDRFVDSIQPTFILPFERHVRFHRNEFRAPDVRRYPDTPVGPEDAWGVVDGESIGLAINFDPCGIPFDERHPSGALHPNTPDAIGPPRVTANHNIFHLLDTGASVAVGSVGRVTFDRNTFVANAVRSLRVSGVVGGPGSDLSLTVTRNLFQSIAGRPWLGLPEGEAPPAFPSPRQVFGAVEVWAFISSFTLSKHVTVQANVFSGFDGVHPTIYGWSGATSPQPLTQWSGLNADIDESIAPVVRLPRIRLVEGRALTVVTFDYHAVLGGPAAPTEPEDVLPFDPDALAARRSPVVESALDHYGEDMDFHPIALSLAGAARERRAWEAWPLIGWGAFSARAAELTDAGVYGRGYFHQPGTTLSALDESFGGGEAVLHTVVGQGREVFVTLPWQSGPRGDDGPPNCVYDGGVCWIDGAGPALRKYILDDDGQTVELPVPANEGGSFGGGAYSEAFVEYWLARAASYVEQIAQLDTENRIAGWLLADEHISKVTTTARPSVAEFLARAREVIREADPVRRPVRLGMSSNIHPTIGAPQYELGAVNLSWNGSSLVGGLAPPAWAQLRHGFFAVGETARQYFGSNEAADRNDTCLELTEGVDPSAVTGRKSTITCKVDYGVALALPMNHEGTLRFLTADVQSSWHLVRSVTGARQAANRTYGHHHVRVLREDLELNEQIADVAMSPTPWSGLVFFNAPVLAEANFDGFPIPIEAGYFRHDFWAGVHHADGIWSYAINQLVEQDPDGLQPTAAALGTEVAHGLELIKGTNPAGAGLRNALGNGWRWQVLHDLDPGPPWMQGFLVNSSTSQNVEFGAGTGRTPQVFLGGDAYRDLICTALRVGFTTWLIITNSVPPLGANTLEFQHTGPVVNLTPASGANLTLGSSVHTVAFSEIDAIVLRLDLR